MRPRERYRHTGPEAFGDAELLALVLGTGTAHRSAGEIAAGLLLASGWDRRSPLVDPMCGSGTFLIEAARLAGDVAPGLNRRFAFPLTILLYPFVIFPAAVSTGRHGKIAAFSGSLILFLTSFFLFSIGSNLAHQDMVPAAVGAW